MKKYLLYILISSLWAVLIISCSKEPIFDIPLDENGEPIITQVSESSTEGVTGLDNEFTVNIKFPNSSPGNEVHVEVLKELQLVEGSEKTISLDGDLKSSVTYTRAEAKLEKINEQVLVLFYDKTEKMDSKDQSVTLHYATNISEVPEVLGNVVNIMHIDDTAWFFVEVEPITFEYTGDVDVTWKRNNEDVWNELGSYEVSNGSAAVPVNGYMFEQEDNIYYSFVTEKEGNQEIIERSFIVSKPQFFKERSTILKVESVDPTLAGKNLLTDAYLEDKDNSMISITDDFHLEGGSAWLGQGNAIEFVSSTGEMYSENNSSNAIDYFEGVSSETSINLMAEGNVYIFKITMADGEEYYGMLKLTNLEYQKSISFDYLIGNMYEHLEAMKK